MKRRRFLTVFGAAVVSSVLPGCGFEVGDDGLCFKDQECQSQPEDITEDAEPKIIEDLVNVGGSGTILDKVLVGFNCNADLEYAAFSQGELFPEETQVDAIELGKWGVYVDTLAQLPGYYGVDAVGFDYEGNEHIGSGIVELMFPFVDAMDYDWGRFVQDDKSLINMSVSDLEMLVDAMEESADVIKLKSYLGVGEYGDFAKELRDQKIYGLSAEEMGSSAKWVGNGFVFRVKNAAEIYNADDVVYEFVSVNEETANKFMELVLP